MLSAGRPPFPPIPLHGRSTAAPSLLSPSVAARFISPSFCPCGGTIQPVLSVAEWIGPSCAQCPPNAPLTPSFASFTSRMVLRDGAEQAAGRIFPLFSTGFESSFPQTLQPPVHPQHFSSSYARLKVLCVAFSANTFLLAAAYVSRRDAGRCLGLLAL